MTEVLRPSDSIVFPSDEMEREIADVIAEMPGAPKWAAFNAVRHLNAAWKILQIDFDMAIFRAITAEEEAASALFRSLQRRHYEGADRLNARDHRHKNAVIPFVDAVSRVFAKFADQIPPATLILDRNKTPPLMKIRLTVPHPQTGEPAYGWPQPPLNFSTTYLKPGRTPRLEDFSAGIEELVANAKASSITQYVSERANQRNRILYAASDGFIEIEASDKQAAFLWYKRHVFTILRTYVLIDPYDTRQDFVQQALFSFLKMLNNLPPDIAF